jgi:hypothetical protein
MDLIHAHREYQQRTKDERKLLGRMDIFMIQVLSAAALMSGAGALLCKMIGV